MKERKQEDSIDDRYVYTLFLSLSRRAESKKLISAVDKQSKGISSLSTYAEMRRTWVCVLACACVCLISVDILPHSSPSSSSFVSAQKFSHPSLHTEKRKIRLPQAKAVGSPLLNRYYTPRREKGERLLRKAVCLRQCTNTHTHGRAQHQLLLHEIRTELCACG